MINGDLFYGCFTVWGIDDWCLSILEGKKKREGSWKIWVGENIIILDSIVKQGLTDNATFG